uniref:Uncharacterized protein n=1 Tax=Propithecus coquereli TaxID=379532 RepID=A0A2K6ESI4_PROCO
MKGIRKGESRAKESKPRETRTRRCAKCGRLDFILMKKMGIKSGFTFWNLVFLLTVSCVKGRSALGGGLTCSLREAEGVDSQLFFPPSDRKCILLARFGVQCGD